VTGSGAWFIDPLAHTWFKMLLSSHPDIERRIARLERIIPSNRCQA